MNTSKMMEKMVVPRRESRKWRKEAGLEGKEAFGHVEYEVRTKHSSVKYPEADKLWDRSSEKEKDKLDLRIFYAKGKAEVLEWEREGESA